jgi:hypothetical protein
VTEERSEGREVEAMRQVVIAAALQFRDAMRAYMVGQVAALAQGATLDETVLRNQEGFHQAAQAEEMLFGLLDRLEAMTVPLAPDWQAASPS